MSFYQTADTFYACLRPVFDRIQTESPDALRGLYAARLALRLKCSAPVAEVTLDGRRCPLQAMYGASPVRPDLDIEMSGDTLHQILLDSLPMKKAVGNGLIKVRGPAWKLKVMLDLFQASRLIYPDVLRQQQLLRPYFE